MAAASKRCSVRVFRPKPLAPADQNSDRSQARHGGKNHENEDRDARRILQFSRLHAGLGADQKNP